jgi:hypothetical protein
MKIFTPARWPIVDQNWKTIIRELQKDILKYILIDATIDGDTTVQHLLGREPIGWFLVDKNAAADVYKVSQSSSDLVLTSASSVNVKIFIF